SVENFLSRERAGGFHEAAIYEDWNEAINDLVGVLRAEVHALRARGARIAAFAASAKGNTLLNACGFDDAVIDYIVDDTPEKIGRFSPGTGIPIVDRDVLAAEPPDYLVILAWNFAKDIVAGTGGYAATGGKYIIPIPAFRVVDPNNGDSL
ncbi:MAG: methyltransferase C-terminal domain-containing protein, partial [Woeseiaceae bacterium]